MLRALLKYKLYIKLSKYIFNYSKVTFFKFIINSDGIRIK